VGAGTVAFVQGLFFVALSPLAGFSLAAVDFPLLLGSLALSCFALCALGFAVAWWLDSTAGYHVVMSLLLLPMWILSGAMFPSLGSRVLSVVQAFDPMSYAVSAVRRAMYGGALPAGTGLPYGAALELLALVLFAGASLAAALSICHKRR
jgi:ABC-2 type transport system permease protein